MRFQSSALEDDIHGHIFSMLTLASGEWNANPLLKGKSSEFLHIFGSFSSDLGR